MAVGLLPAAALAVDAPQGGGGRSAAHRPDNLSSPLADKQFQARQKGLEQKLEGKGDGKVAQVGKGQYVELAQEGMDNVFTILVEFGGSDGPLAGQIAEPDRSTDNSTYWVPNFDRSHYQNMLFSTAPGANSMSNFYKEQSSGRYTVDGTVTDWVRVNKSEWEYGRNQGNPAPEDTVYRIVGDAIAQWTADQTAAGMTAAEIKEYLKRFDVRDRYDYDGDGNFNEPDGYIDHFQIIHAGEGEEAGGGAQGSDAIWSHRWYANFADIGSAGPSDYAPFGGYQFPGTDMWVGDYTIEPENGGVGVFAHEYAHDLGLPDEYDQTYTGEAPTAFWTLMSSGSWLGDGKDSIGTKPNHMNAWDKFQLGWLNYDVARAGVKSTHRVGPAETNTKAAQAVITVLPKRLREITIVTPAAGSYEWWSGMGDNYQSTLTRSIDLTGVSSPALSFKAWYNIETDWDYAYVEVSDDGGTSWTALAGNITTTTNPNGQNTGNGITGSSRAWKDANFDLSPYAGKAIQLRFRYWTDGAVTGKGFAADEINVTSASTSIFYDGAENGDNGWTASRFSRIAGKSSKLYSNYYIAEYRQYRGFDTTLKTGPYNFVNPAGNWVEHFPYQDGLLLSYWDTFYTNNQVGVHPGEGLILPIDANPQPVMKTMGTADTSDDTPWRTRVQVYDATFGLEKTDSFVLSYLNRNRETVAQRFPSRPAVSTFNDLNPYWYASAPDSGVKVPQTGTTIQVVEYNTQGNFMQILVRPSK